MDAAGGSGASGGATVALAMRALAPRLGSTMLVSHLGSVTTDAATDLAFYPVTAGGAGLSLGAVTQNDSTTLTLRGRASRWDDDTLTGLLTRVTEALG